jgi:hypothetical protein
VATASLMANIGNLFLLGSGEQVIGGFAAELVDRLVAAGAASGRWKSREVPGVVMDSERLKVVLIEMLEEAGVEVLTHALAARPILGDGRVLGAFVESKAGREAVLAGAVVDATGEADLAHRAGSPTVETGGSASILFKLANVDVERFVRCLGEDPDGFPSGRDFVKDLETFERNWRDRGILFFPHHGGKTWRLLGEAMARAGFAAEDPPARDLDAMGLYGVGRDGWIAVNSANYRVDSLDLKALSRFETHAQKTCYRVAEFMIANIPGFEKAYVAHIGVDLGVRTARRLEGRRSLETDAVRGASRPARSADVVGLTPARHAKPVDGAFVKDFASDVPFGIMVPASGPSGIIVGSAKSVSTAAAGLIRGMSGCMVVGQAAGVAAALGAASGVSPGEVPVGDVQRRLLNQGVFLGGEARLMELGLAG